MPKNIIGTARVAGMDVHPDATEKLVKHFFCSFTKEEQKSVLFHDKTAVLIGNELVKIYCTSETPTSKNNFIAAKLRLLADLFIQAKQIDNTIMEVENMYCPTKYETVVQAINRRSQFGGKNMVHLPQR